MPACRAPGIAALVWRLIQPGCSTWNMLPQGCEAALADAEPAEQGVEHVFGGGAAEQRIEPDPGEQTLGDVGGSWASPARVSPRPGLGEQAVLAGIERGIARAGQGIAGRGDEVGAQPLGQRR